VVALVCGWKCSSRYLMFWLIGEYRPHRPLFVYSVGTLHGYLAESLFFPFRGDDATSSEALPPLPPLCPATTPTTDVAPVALCM